MRLRLPADADLTKGPAKLKDIPEADGWVATPPTKDTPTNGPSLAKSVADAAGMCWFPTEGLARAWHGFVTKGKAAIAAPAPLGDGHPFAPTEAGKPVPLKLTGVKDATAFDVFAGGEKVASFARKEGGDTAEFTIEKLPSGVHALVVIPGNAVPLKPAAVVVK